MRTGELAILALIVAATLILPGSDIYTHIHQAWLYNYMMAEQQILAKDFSMLSGEQPMYGIGVPSFLVAGVAWFAFEKATIKILEIIAFAFLVLITRQIFHQKRMLILWHALVFAKILLPDSYPYMVSTLLFYLGIWLLNKGKSLGEAAILLAGVNHPYVAASNMVSAFWGNKRLLLSSIAVVGIQILLLKFVFFAGATKFEFDNVLDMAIRTAILLFPLAMEPIGRIKVPMRAFQIASLKPALAIAAGGIVLLYPFFYVPFEMGWKEGLNCYYFKDYNELPNLQGNVRIVDSCRSWIYELPKRGMVLSLSPYFEGQFYQHEWTEKEYLQYLNDTNTSHVVYCKDCKIKTKTLKETGELEILRSRFRQQEIGNYYVFAVDTPAPLSEANE